MRQALLLPLSTCGAPARRVAPQSRPIAANASSSSSAIPPSGPTTITISPLAGNSTDGQGGASRPRAVRKPGVGKRRARSPIGQAASRREPRPGGSAWPPRAPCGATCSRPLSRRAPVPLRNRARGRPRDDRVDAEFGHRLDGEFSAIALGQGLDDDQPRVGSQGRCAVPRRAGQPVTSHGGDRAVGKAAAAVTDDERLAHGSRRTRAACRPSSPVSAKRRRQAARRRGTAPRSLWP